MFNRSWAKARPFLFFFPFQRGHTHRAVEAPTDTPKVVSGTETIMIVDDETDVSYFVEVILKLQGYGVVTAGSAEEALEKLRAAPDQVDLLFSDVGLPRLDGFGLNPLKPEKSSHA